MLYCIYVVVTTETKNITVMKKYKYTTYGFTKFMIVDENGVHYCITNSLLYCKWSNMEVWHNIDTNKEFIMKYYGWRVPILGMFPNIVVSKQVVNVLIV
jgi:aldehyde:ferredoxin oxidoreductase